MDNAAEAAIVEDAGELACTVLDDAGGELQRVDTRRLLAGMFVAGLDRPWSDTPLPPKGVLVQTDEELQAIRRYCQFVMVDPGRSSGELAAAIRAAAVLSRDPAFGGHDEASSGHGPAPHGSNGAAAPLRDASPRHRVTASSGIPKPRDDVHPGRAARAGILRLVRDGEAAPPAKGSWTQLRRWLGRSRSDSPDATGPHHRAALERLRDAWGESIGACDHGEGAPIRESITLARPAHACLVAAGDAAIRQVRQGTALAFEPLAEAAEAFAAAVAAAPDAMRWVQAVHANHAPAPNPAIAAATCLAEFGRALGMDRAALRDLTLIGMLGDIGKALLPREVLEHPGVLAPSQHALLKQHVTIGLDILSRAGTIPPAILRGVAEHHERLDGSGYPNGLRASAIGLHGRMAAIADSFGAITAARAYANPLSAQEALAALYEWSGSLFCRDLVEQFVLATGAFPVGTLVELQTGEVAAVVGRRPGSRLQPKLVVMTGADKGPPRSHGATSRMPEQAGHGHSVSIARGLPAGAFGLRLRDYFSTPT